MIIISSMKVLVKDAKMYHLLNIHKEFDHLNDFVNHLKETDIIWKI